MGLTDKKQYGESNDLTIDQYRFKRWKFLFKAHADGKKCGLALRKPKPKIDDDHFTALLDDQGNET